MHDNSKTSSPLTCSYFELNKDKMGPELKKRNTKREDEFWGVSLPGSASRARPKQNTPRKIR
jgi:hypothetical protein